MTLLTLMLKDPEPPAALFDTAPISPPDPGTQLVTTLQWNNLIDLLQGTSDDEIDMAALEALTVNKAVETDAAGHLIASLITNTELNHLSGISSNIQDQIDTKSAVGHTHLEADITNLGTAVALIADNLGVFAGTTSAQLLSVMTDETGAGLLVFNNSPTLITPAIASFTNATHDHLNAAGGGKITEAAISDLGTAIALLATTQTFSGNKTFSGELFATGNMRIPADAAPTMAVDGDLALDTTIADFSHGLLKYFSVEELAVIAVPVAELATPDDGSIIAYNATNDKFELVAGTSVLTSNGTYSHPNGTTEQTVLAVPANEARIEIDYDVSLLTQNTIVRVYEEVDGTNPEIVSEKTFPTDFDANVEVIVFELVGKGRDQSITFQSQVAEGGAVDIPWTRRDE